MKIVGMMLAKNEEWVLNLSIPAALEWVDELIIVEDSSTDRTPQICLSWLRQFPKCIHYTPVTSGEFWEEMTLRQYMYELALQHDPDVVALIDADEVLSRNLCREVRNWAGVILPGEGLDVPMIPTWRGLGVYRDDRSVWSRGIISLLVKLGSNIWWSNAADDYAHHSRLPHGITGRRCGCSKNEGGVFHLQFANWNRLKAKHAWYKMTERVRWPDRPKSSVDELNRKYGQALDEAGLACSAVPPEWWFGLDLSVVDLESPGWFPEECKRLMKKYGRETFAGLDLFGVL